MENLIHETIENTPVTDNMGGFTITQLFGALQFDVTTVPQYKAKLIVQNPTFSSTNITTLISQHHY